MSTEIGAYNYPLTIVAGNTLDVDYQSGVEAAGVFTATDITDLAITGAVVQNYGDTSPVATFTIDKYDPANGFFRVSIDNVVSAALPVAQLKYEVRSTNNAKAVDTMFRGNFNVLAGIPS